MAKPITVGTAIVGKNKKKTLGKLGVIEQVSPHGRQWTPRKELLIDPGSKPSARFRWPEAQRGIGTKKEVDYFYKFYSVRGIGKTLEYTNVNMLTHSYIPLTKGKFFKYLGLRLAMACEPKRGAIYNNYSYV